MRKATSAMPVVAMDRACSTGPVGPGLADAEAPTEYAMRPIGYVRKDGDRTTIVVREEYQRGLFRLEQLSRVWVLWWFDKNDAAGKRAVLQVHPQGNPDRPLTGVFATHAPVRPNLIAMTRCDVLSVAGNVVEIESIDAFSGTPVLDLKSG